MALILIFTSGCSGYRSAPPALSPTSSSSLADTKTPDIETIVTEKPEPVFRSSWGGMGIFLDSTPVGMQLDSDGKVYHFLKDGSKVQILQLDASLVDAIRNKISRIGNLQHYTLTPTSEFAVCDIAWTHQFYKDGGFVTWDQQQDCGFHMSLRIESCEPNQSCVLDLPQGTIDLWEAIEGLEALIDVIEAYLNSGAERP